MTNLALAPGRRLIFRNCKLLRFSRYVSEFRGQSVWLCRYEFETPDMSERLVYSGKSLGIGEGETVTLKGTIKRHEKYGRKYIRISRPILLDISTPLPLEGF